MEGFEMENEKSEKGRNLEIVFLGTIVVLLVVQSLFSIFNFVGIQQLKAFFHKEDVNVGTSEFQDLINQKLIDCELKNEKGDSVLLESLIESPTLLVFTNHSCQACQSLYPELKDFSRSNQDIKIILITTNTPEENAIFLEEDLDITQLGWEVLSGIRQVFENYNITGTPTLAFIDEPGVIRNIGYASSKSQIVELINYNPWEG
jgi:thioredoxin-related protein